MHAAAAGDASTTQYNNSGKCGNGAPASVATPPREVWQRENRCGLNQFDVNVDVVVIASANGNVFKVRSGLFWGVFILVHV